MRAAVTTLVGLLLVLTVVAAACGGNESAGRSGVPEVDAVVEALLTGDQEALRGMVEYGQVPCSTESGTGRELCRPDEPDGTLVDAVVAADCEGYFIRPDGIDVALGALLEGAPKLYAVYKVPPPSPNMSIGPDYVAVFSAKGPAPGQVFGRALGMGDGDVVAVNLGCGQSPEQLGQSLEQDGWTKIRP
jgi:hypothetical protein